MRKIGFILAPLAILAGIAGYFLRAHQVATVFDPHSGLATPNAAISLVLMALSAVAVLLFFGLSTRVPNREGADFATAFGCSTPVRAILALLAVAMMLLGGVRAALLVLADDLQVFSLVWAGAACLTGLFLALLALRGPKGRNVAIPASIPVFFISMWLIILHIDQAANPVLLAYVYRLFALAFLLLSMYYIASFAFCQAKTGRLTFAVTSTVYFTGVTLADGGLLYQNITLLVLAATGLVYLLILTHNLSRPIWEVPPPDLEWGSGEKEENDV